MSTLQTPAQRAVDALLSSSIPQLLLMHEYEDKSCRKVYRKVPLLFSLAFTLHALGQLETSLFTAPQRKKIKKLVQYLSSENEGRFGYNYWPTSSPNYEKEALPDDLDDTAACLTALIKHSQPIAPEYFLKIINLERQAGGPYYTWYIDPQSDPQHNWQDVDPIVNAHFLYLAELWGVKLPKLESYILRQINKGKVTSPYYPSPLIFWYYFAKFAHTRQDQKYLDLVIEVTNKFKFPRLDLADKLLWGLCRSYAGKKLSSIQLKIIHSNQDRSGWLPTTPICFGFPTQDKHPTYCASKVVSTALFLELVTLQHKLVATKKAAINTWEKSAIKTAQFVNKLLQRQIWGKQILQQYPISDKYKALYLPFLLGYSLKPTLSADEQHRLQHLSIAGCLYWISFTLMDDILDNQKDSKYLPLTFALRNLAQTELASACLGFPGELKQLQQALANTDAYYVWESQHLHFADKKPQLVRTPDYIYDRLSVFAEAMSIIPNLLRLKSQPTISMSIREVIQTSLFLEQLNDDAHDYEEDFQQGTNSYVLSQIWKRTHDPRQFNLVFWEKIITHIYSLAQKKVDVTKQHIQKLRRLGINTDIFEQLLMKNMHGLEQAISERESTLRLVTDLASSESKPNSI